MTLHVAVDFGTSSTCTVASLDGAEPHVVVIDGHPLLSSALFASGDGTLFVGQEAERQAAVDPARFEPHPKRRIDEVELLLGGTVLAVGDAIRAVLTRAVDEARRYAGGAAVDLLVLTHPADWGTVRTGRLRHAAAGLATEVVLLPEPVGAAVFHAAGHGLPDGAALAVLDLGGGTVDASLVRRTDESFRVLATRGKPDFGGADIDQALLEHVGSTVEPVDPAGWRQLVQGREIADRRRRRVLRQDVRGAKETLSRHSYTDVPLPPPFSDTLVTRSDLESLIVTSLSGVADLVPGVLADGGVTERELAAVFLVGGSSRVPMVARLIHERTGIVPTTLDQPETVVARGALRGVREDPTREVTRALRVPPGSGRLTSGSPAGSGAPVPPPHSGGPPVPGHQPPGSAPGAWPSGTTTPVSGATASGATDHGGTGFPGSPGFSSAPDGKASPRNAEPARRGGSSRWKWLFAVAAVLLVLGAVATLAITLFLPAAGGGHVARYGYEFEYPAGWGQGGGDPELWETRIRPPDSGGDEVISVRAGRPGYDVSANRRRSVRELREKFDGSDSELSDFESDTRFAGERVVHYRERLSGSVVDWYVLHRSRTRISIGCQYDPAGERRVTAGCERVVRSVSVR
ncbi:type VII secretion-associated protein, Rv3446c family, C-terminal domain-containing protein [Actinopolyspora lacussalsi subsp. righensis]|uniref:Type VII secretion-associated protein, Rv3446c family, C-terminal domain-containing protein n=1 Tax=Actinopolyspora righensis TaxID=995060 RepID=A0A1I6Z748_9ACTN|nr:type VII secretion-associated protein [Actinopolyspora righensis]SFT58468.1 type VII secretion-associated protein, Rv3446c family, C-terminal domain-containing protein [Actinopolyspora righensis]